MIKKKNSITGAQKAATLMVALGVDLSAELFQHLSSEEIEEIVLEISRLPKFSTEKKNQILNEVQEIFRGQRYLSQGDLSYARQLLIEHYGVEKAEEILKKISQSIVKTPFSLLKNIDQAQFINFLKLEHPQTVALLLSYLPPEKASIFLKELESDVQADVARRIALMDKTSPEVIVEMENMLEQKIHSLSNERYSVAGGIKSIVDILNLSDRGTEKSIIEYLENTDEPLANLIKQKMFVFEDIVLLEDRVLQQVLRTIDVTDLALALKGVEQNSVKEKVFRNVSKNWRELIKEEISFMGPVRRKKVEEMQQKIVSTIKQMEERGELVISRGQEEEYV